MENHDEQREFDLGEDGKGGCSVQSKERNLNDFHRLWTGALPARNYNKKAWLDIERQLLEAGMI